MLNNLTKILFKLNTILFEAGQWLRNPPISKLLQLKNKAQLPTLCLVILIIFAPGCAKNKDEANGAIMRKKRKPPYIAEKHLKWQKGLDLSRNKAREPLYNRFVAEGGMAKKDGEGDDLIGDGSESQFKKLMEQKIRGTISN